MTYEGLRNAALLNRKLTEYTEMAVLFAYQVCLIDTLQEMKIPEEQGTEIVLEAGQKMGQFHAKYDCCLKE